MNKWPILQTQNSPVLNVEEDKAQGTDPYSLLINNVFREYWQNFLVSILVTCDLHFYHLDR